VQNYHLEELAIAKTRSDPRCVLPDFFREHKRILDVGCGAGQTLIACAVDGPDACGVDVDVLALRLGKKLSPRTNFVVATGEALPFRDAYFDMVISRVALPYMRVTHAVAELSRVSRPGGSLWLTLHGIDYTKNQLLGNLRNGNLPRVIFQFYALVNGVVLRLWSRQFNFPFTGRCESFQTSEGMRRILAAAGFTNIQIERGLHFVITARKCAGAEATVSASLAVQQHFKTV
jgi:ubiquinone/menaquinone biosynthesis C-methylase UbiE